VVVKVKEIVLFRSKVADRVPVCMSEVPGSNIDPKTENSG
jgi:hypothetical protein